MQNNGVIKGFIPLINTVRMGYIYLRLYLTFQYLTSEKKQEIIDYLVKTKIVVVVVRAQGKFDMIVFVAVKNLSDFTSFYYKMLGKYRDYFLEIIFSLYSHEYLYERFLIFDESDNKRVKSRHKPIPVLTIGSTVKTDDLDHRILKLLVTDALMPVSCIAEKLGVTSTTINNRIKKLRKVGIITGFSILIDYTKIGHQWYKISIDLKEYGKRGQIITFLETQQYLFAILQSIGHSDLELECLFKDINHLTFSMENLINKFPDAIKKYSYTALLDIYKYKYFPEY